MSVNVYRCDSKSHLTVKFCVINSMLLNFVNLIVLISTLAFIKCEINISKVNPQETQYFKFNMVTDIKPIRYHIDISLDPSLNFQYYNATSKIEFRPQVTSNFFAFHLKFSHLMQIHNISLVNSATLLNLANFKVTSFKDRDDHLIGIESKDAYFLEQDENYVLIVDYTVRFQEGDRSGFFKFCYKNNEVKDTCFATTHFEVHNIRLAFPSFDNATLKAHFKISVTHNSDMIANSNMPGRQLEHDNGTTTTVFDESPLMPTYAVAIAIGKFKCSRIENLNNLTMNLYTPAGIGKSTILEKYAGHFVNSLEKYLNKPFPLPKLDYLASHTATDTIQGMEHWGFISFDGDSILDVDDIENVERTENSIKVITHEIVHQYFGNLVSVKELNSMWLKEGLTTYFTSFVSSIVFPEEKYMERMFLIDYVYAMHYDTIDEFGQSINNFEPLYRDLQNSLVQIHVIYTKGSAFTNMVYHVLGEESFQKFIQNLINNFEYDSISTDDFINELQFINDLDAKIPEDVDISEFVYSWINQPKYPIITIIRNYDTDYIEIRQDSFQNKMFWIPFNYATKSAPNFDITTPNGWLKNVHALNISVPNLKVDDWILFNKQSVGYYVVNYDVRNWNLIVNALSSDKGFQAIPSLNRAKLFLDASILYGKGQLSDDILFKVINSLKWEHSYITWSIVQTFMFSLSDLRSYLVENVDVLIPHFYSYYGPEHYTNDTRATKLGRIKAINMACSLNYKNCLQDMEMLATKINQQEQDFDDINIDIAMFEIIYQYGLQNDVQFETFFRKINRSQNKEIETIFYQNLEGKVKIPAFQKIFLTSVYDLPSSNADEDLRFNLNLMEIDNFFDLKIINDCLLANCYDFTAVFPNTVERNDRIYKMVEMMLKNMERPKYVFAYDSIAFPTIHELLGNIDRMYGGDIENRIRETKQYDLNTAKLNVG